MTNIPLRDGNVTHDRRLDRLVEFDDRSRAFAVRAIVPKKPRSYTWQPFAWLDQGSEGACVGFAWAHEIGAKPAVHTHLTNDNARDIYHEARRIDEWEGEKYEGTSVLAGAKVVIGLKYMKEYRWAFGLEDLILAVGYAGPAVLGINWYSGMLQVDEHGFIHPTGSVAGGHAILCYGVNIPGRYFKLHNSWGAEWGKNGDCYLSFEDMDRLLHEQGEACVPVGRNRIKL